MGLEIPPLFMKIVLESNPLKSTMLGGLGVLCSSGTVILVVLVVIVVIIIMMIITVTVIEIVIVGDWAYWFQSEAVHASGI